MRPGYFVQKILFQNGNELELLNDSIVVIVGPNNSGKSKTLSELSNLIRSKEMTGNIIKEIFLEQKGSNEEIFSFIKSISRQDVSGIEPVYRGYKLSMAHSTISVFINDYKNRGLVHLSDLFANIIGTNDRLQIVNSPENISVLREAPHHPIHNLLIDDTLEHKFSEYFYAAFGQDLVVHRNAGKIVPLFVGKRPITENGEDRLSISYIQKVEKLSPLDSQGDGMKSFVGVMLHSFNSSYAMLLIDEPEAFLHPPQARLLGKMLAKDLPQDCQMFLATHSEDFLKGLLDSNTNRIKVIRIQRENSTNKIFELNSSDIKSVWNDSLLRHSNILNSLFHSKVIICESDSDCRFYSAILDAISEIEKTINPDVLFTHCGGKHRIPTAIKALKKLNVSISVVVDFDILNDENPLKEIYEDLGGKWADISGNWKIVKTAVDSKRPDLLTTELKKVIDHIFSQITSSAFPKERIKELQSVLKKSSPWSEAKSSGKAFIPSGDASNAFEQLKTKLIALGLFIVEVGELEGFARTIGNHGPAWVSEVLSKKDLKTDIELESARQFVRTIV